MRSAFLAACCLGVMLLGACSSTARISSGAPPTVICGTDLSHAAAGAGVENLVPNGAKREVVTGPTVGGVVIIRVATGCKVGATVTLTPKGSYRISRTVEAADGLPVAVVLRPLRPVPTVVTARRDGQVIGRINLDIPRSYFDNG